MVVRVISLCCAICRVTTCHCLSEYVITMPNMYARGILFGKMVLELGDSCTAKNEKNGYSCDIDFKTKVGILVRCPLHRGYYKLSPGLLLWNV